MVRAAPKELAACSLKRSAHGCIFDYETYSEANLKKTGSYRYAEDPSTEINMACFALDDGPVDVWLPFDILDIPQEVLDGIKLHPGAELFVQKSCPQKLLRYLEDPEIQIAGWNVAFERVISKYVGPKYGIPPVPITRWICTMAKARAASMPGGLGECAKVMSSHPKDEVGKLDMMSLAKPRTGKEKRWWPWTAPKRWISTINYCIDDVASERELDHRLPELVPYEQKVYWFDQKVNQRGIKVDLAAVHMLRKLRDEYRVVLAAKCRELTRVELTEEAEDYCAEHGLDPATCKIAKGTPKEIAYSILMSRGLAPGQTGALAHWVRTVGGYPSLPDLQKETLTEIIDDPKMPQLVRRVLRIYNLYGMKAVAKFDAILNAVCSDGCLRGLFIYSQAGTGRWSSVIVQLHNLFKTVIKDPEMAIDIAMHGDLYWLAANYDENVMKVLASCIRSLLVARPGREFNVLDFNSIEGRVTHWLAGDERVLDIYRTHGKMYEYAAAQIYGLDPEDIELLKNMKKTHPTMRQAGKVAELSMGFQGGLGALERMVRSENAKIPKGQPKITLTVQDMIEIRDGWRRGRPKVKHMWYALEDAAKQAVAEPGSIWTACDGKIMFRVEGEWLCMRLPSGRRLRYYKPEIDANDRLVYQGIDTYTRQWGTTSTYGGRLTENAVQAIARDLLVRGLMALEAAGYPVVGHVHDEAITEVPVGFGSLAESAKIICPDLPWAGGLPVKAAGFRGARYRKDD
jgi:DNA polymerase